MKELTASTRAVLDTIRIVLIWAIFLIPFGTSLCATQDNFVFVAVSFFFFFYKNEYLNIYYAAHRSHHSHLWGLYLQRHPDHARCQVTSTAVNNVMIELNFYFSRKYILKQEEPQPVTEADLEMK